MPDNDYNTEGGSAKPVTVVNDSDELIPVNISEGLPLDDTTGALETIEYAHHEIHEGKHFFYYDSITLGSGESQAYLITVPAGVYPHIIIHMDGIAVTQKQVYEGSDWRYSGTKNLIYNRLIC